MGTKKKNDYDLEMIFIFLRSSSNKSCDSIFMALGLNECLFAWAKRWTKMFQEVKLIKGKFYDGITALASFLLSCHCEVDDR